MTPVNKTIFLTLIFVLLLLLQTNNFLETAGVTPNLVLTGFLILPFITKKGEIVRRILVIALILSAVAIIWIPFWIWGIVLSALLGITVSFLKKIMVGSVFFDFFTSVIIGTLIFYAVLAGGGLSVLIWPQISLEILYNLILGELILITIKKFK